MASLKEIKGRIASVNGTLKITSAMKLVASAKLKKAQTAVEAMLPYSVELGRILDMAGAEAVAPYVSANEEVSKPTIVCFASNSSLCGGFNSAAARLARETIKSYVDRGIPASVIRIIPIGKKMAEALRKDGLRLEGTMSDMAEKPSYAPAARLAERLMEDFENGVTDHVELVFNHFKSTAVYVPTRKTFLPFDGREDSASGSEGPMPEDYIIEPGKEALVAELLPKVLKLKLFTALLDSAAAEHSARTIAMQTATDNANDLLAELTLEYNKRRQQKITDELLDLEGGSMS